MTVDVTWMRCLGKWDQAVPERAEVGGDFNLRMRWRGLRARRRRHHGR